ncbi:YihY/virulence factor BrkB family protein [Maricaulaceae bacterium EIL42A08]|nr:YihY/virulence factor BrkB family protein [Maricaulaceae bacterium EIL42A08]MCP2678544.1 YihY/virulence factor BrkB family protein [Maricaulaceae bacterium NA33B04]
MSAARLISAVKAVWAWLAGIAALRIIVRAVDRMMAREVMLFAGGAGFFGLLALFPAVLVGVSIYGLLFSPENAVAQMTQLELAGVLPPSANNFLNAQLSGLANASRVSLTFQGAIAFAIAVFASARGAKAVIAGLNQIARRGDLRNILHFNLLAMGAVFVGGGLLLTANLIILTVPNLIRPALRMLGSEAADAAAGMINEWTVGGLAMAMALSLLYRFIMQRAGETSWRASLIGAGVATAIWLAASKGFTLYVSAVIDPNIYGPLGALIVFLLWVYWTSYVMFFGGALAVEIDRYRERLPEQLEAGNS